jgi:hypothetical protein
LIVDIVRVTTALRQYVKLRWVDAHQINNVLGNDAEPRIRARYWDNNAGYFEVDSQLERTMRDRAPEIIYRVVGQENLPELESDQWRKQKCISSQAA